MKEKIFTPMTIISGGLLATMIFLNGILSSLTNPIFSSLIVHIAGLVTSFILWMLFNPSRKGRLVSRNTPFWSYCGGISGALAVVLANIVVNSSLGLAGSLSLFILGQTLTSLVIDVFGLLGSDKRTLSRFDYIRVGAIFSGALLLINAGGK